MASISSFRLILLVAAGAVVLFMMLDEGTFGASAEPRVSLKLPPKLSSKFTSRFHRRRPAQIKKPLKPSKPAKPAAPAKPPPAAAPPKPSRFPKENVDLLLTSAASTMGNVAQTKLMYGSYGAYGGYGGYGGRGYGAAGGAVAAGAAGDPNPPESADTTEGDESASSQA
ncbi:hypothetical protein MTO96_026928 [Rhipicephalus appendiculatus]